MHPSLNEQFIQVLDLLHGDSDMVIKTFYQATEPTRMLHISCLRKESTALLCEGVISAKC